MPGLGQGIMEYWNDGSRERNTTNMTFSAFAAHHSIIPSFHHSIIPWGRRRVKARKNPLTFPPWRDRNPETFISRLLVVCATKN
jgi:hypothetical protein